MPPSRSAAKKQSAKAPSSRAKSGCYTCRIRRKKCDEKQDESGSCESCIRLRIQCLGFGAKRPDWLRESSRVQDLREKIKAHLASQGMIKGHSGSGPRNVDGDHAILKLSYDDYSSATESPTTPSLSLSSTDDPKPSPSQSPWVELGGYSGSVLLPSSSVDLVEPSYPPPSDYDDHMITYPSIPSHTLTSATPNWNNIVAIRHGPQSYSTYSSFSTTYHQHYDDSMPYETNAIAPQSSIFYDPPDPLLVHYTTHVIPIEYLLADKRTIDVLIQAMGAFGTAGEAARLLSIVHQYRSSSTFHNRRALESPDVASRYQSLKSIFYKSILQEDDAFAALQVVSVFLFDGGMGGWCEWLRVACNYCAGVLRRPQYGSAARALLSVNETTRFIIQTSMWFDVLASVTLGEEPHFLHEFRELYDPNNAHIDDDPGLSMVSIMGCENLTVWALAEISTLAKWKADQLAQGRLSVPKLVEKARNIEHFLDTAPTPSLENRNEVDSCRILACRIFRASAIVYLHSVVSGNRPLVPEISRAVSKTIDIINQVPETGAHGISRSVMRSTVFSLFICGALTDDLEQQNTILNRLRNQHSSETVGNTSSVTSLLQGLWAERQRRNRPDEEVYWREALKESQILLV